MEPILVRRAKLRSRGAAGAELRILVVFSFGIRQSGSGKGERTENPQTLSQFAGRPVVL